MSTGSKKTFNQVNHWTLFAKLIDTQVPLLIVRVFFCNLGQKVCIK